MTTTKKVAKSLVNILDNKRLKAIRDLTADIEPVVEEIINHWEYDLFNRRPGPALDENGVFVGTDLDLACFIAALADRGAVINLPEYESMRGSQITEGQRVISKENRHGKITGITSNKEVFSFSIRIFDVNIAVTNSDGSEDVGAFRNFTIVSPEGEWHEGWRTIEFSPSAEENEFLYKNDLLTDNAIVFKNFVHPNRWISLYGQYYFITKALITRLEKQNKFLDNEINRLLGEGVKYPQGKGKKKKEWPKKTKVGNERTVKFKAFDSEVDFNGFEGEFESIEKTTEELVRITELRRKWVYNSLASLRFAVRATEMAFYKHGIVDGEEKMPAWIENADWQRDYVQKGKRKKWNRLILTQPGVGELGISIRYRIWEKSEKIAL